MSEHYKTCAVPGCNYQADWCDGHRTVSHDDGEGNYSRGLQDGLSVGKQAAIRTVETMRLSYAGAPAQLLDGVIAELKRMGGEGK